MAFSLLSLELLLIKEQKQAGASTSKYNAYLTTVLILETDNRYLRRTDRFSGISKHPLILCFEHETGY